MLVAYPVLFYYDDTQGENVAPYFVYIPDLEGSTQGGSIPDALTMASEVMGILLADSIETGQPIPQPSPLKSLDLAESNPFKDDIEFDLVYDPEKSFVSLVTVDVVEYLGQQEPIKKTLTIPKWADKLGRELGLNFSQTLTEAIAERKLQA